MKLKKKDLRVPLNLNSNIKLKKDLKASRKDFKSEKDKTGK